MTGSEPSSAPADVSPSTQRVGLWSLALGAASLVWGLYWIPIRGLSAQGVPDVLITLVIFGASTLALTPVIALRWRRLVLGGRQLALTGLITGTALALYSTALLYSEVVRVLLLFYLTPLWSTLLEAMILRHRLPPSRFVALALGALGLCAILGLGRDGAGLTLPVPRNVGDWMALVSGMLWSIGTLRVFSQRAVAGVDHAVALIIGCLPAAAVVVLLAPVGAGVLVGQGAAAASVPAVWWSLLAVVLITVPPALVMMSGARRISPARVGLLLMGELIMGVATAALFSGERFSVPEAIGTALILSAVVVELVRLR